MLAVGRTSPDVGAGSGSSISAGVGTFSGSRTSPDTLMLAVVVALESRGWCLVLGWYFQW
ncbi:AIS_collapsed_G0016660.mRNA.1.CDS.1 [Saccharomyces cerevisiae]|nr:AIS_collapsed_G0016660.mRNA.1.CDS.1 [Saccharomyces cerevisiae]